eukprot:5766748-Amphidinium_carterae.1
MHGSELAPAHWLIAAAIASLAYSAEPLGWYTLAPCSTYDLQVASSPLASPGRTLAAALAPQNAYPNVLPLDNKRTHKCQQDNTVETTNTTWSHHALLP